MLNASTELFFSYIIYYTFQMKTQPSNLQSIFSYMWMY